MVAFVIRGYILLGQYVEEVHEALSEALPEHCFPSYLGAGFVHVLDLVFVPVVDVPYGVQVNEHVPHDPQLAQFPSTRI